MKLSSAHISAMKCSSHFFQASVRTSEGGNEFLYGGRYRRASGMAPSFFRPGNTIKGILFHPQIYETPKFSACDRENWLTGLTVQSKWHNGEKKKKKKKKTGKTNTRAFDPVWNEQKIIFVCPGFQWDAERKSISRQVKFYWSYTVSKLVYKVQFFLNRLHEAVLKMGYITCMCIYQFIPGSYDWLSFSRCQYTCIWMGWVYFRTHVRTTSVPTIPSLPRRPHPRSRSVPSLAKQALCPAVPFNSWQQRPFKRLLKLTYRCFHFMYFVWKINIMVNDTVHVCTSIFDHNRFYIWKHKRLRDQYHVTCQSVTCACNI